MEKLSSSLLVNQEKQRVSKINFLRVHILLITIRQSNILNNINLHLKSHKIQWQKDQNNI